MIQANELRIGNWVSLKCLVYYVGDDHSPHKINIHNLVSLSENDKEWEFLPILLTPEILEKCGFKTNKLKNLFKRVSKKTEGMKSEVHLHDYYEEKKYYYLLGSNIIITHLHQLQNLYFALTNEELIIEL